jgi:hypothetical protein
MLAFNVRRVSQGALVKSARYSEGIMRQRKTRNCWRFYVNYGQGWEHEITEYTFAEMRENRKAYRENCPYPLRVRFGRERIEAANG